MTVAIGVGSTGSALPFEPPAPIPAPLPKANFIALRSLLALPTLLRNPIETISQQAYEEPVSYTQLFNRPIAVVSDPDVLRTLFIDNADALDLDAMRQAVLKPALKDGMLTAEGEVWRRGRRTIAPVFAPRHIHGFAQSMDETTAAFTDELLNDIGPDGKTVPADELMTILAYRILSRTLFTGDLDDKGEKILSDVAYFLKHLSQPDPLDFLGAPSWVPRLTKLRGQQALKRLRKTVKETATARRSRIVAGEDVPEDFLTLLLNAGSEETLGESGTAKLTMDEIEDNIITFIAAGHETTARAVAWMLYLLSFDQQALKRCEAEADSLDIENVPAQEWGEHVPWIKACFEETMRLFPPAALIARTLNRPVTIGEHNWPKDLNILAAPWVLHRHETLWENPRAFVPARMFGDNRKAVHRFAYLPFGLGSRVCIGSSFAMQEAMIIMVHLLRKVRFEFEGERKPWPVMRVTVQPDKGIAMRARPR